MKLAIEKAKIAGNFGEVPVGAVIVNGNNEIISTGFNKREKLNNSLAHAEIVAINSACKKLNSWRILNSTIYVTMEPCLMCAGAIINSRIERVIFGTSNINEGCFGSLVDLSKFVPKNKLIIEGGFFEKEINEILFNFFRKVRKK